MPLIEFHSVALSLLSQAASSGRMADLLGGELATGFIGFETASRGIGGREGEQDGGTEEVSHGAGAEFQVVMKQLGKRDTTTKIKVKIIHIYLQHVRKVGNSL